MKFRIWAAALGAVTSISSAASAMPVMGEQHRQIHHPEAALRDAEGRENMVVTIWYPAQAGAPMESIDIGDPASPVFRLGMVARDAPFADSAKRPAILLSHGFGGVARLMSWFARGMVERGYIVISVNHPGNTGIETMTAPGAAFWWERAVDLRAALAAAIADPVIGRHIDTDRIGAAGFSIGGFTALVAGGLKPSPENVLRFCAENPEDGICMPQIEYPVPITTVSTLLAEPKYAAAKERMQSDLRLPNIRAVLAMAPVVQTGDLDSLGNIAIPIALVTGDKDEVVSMETQSKVAHARIAQSSLTIIEGATHYSFLGQCTETGRQFVPICKEATVQDEVHRTAIATAAALFEKAFAEVGSQ